MIKTDLFGAIKLPSGNCIVFNPNYPENEGFDQFERVTTNERLCEILLHESGKLKHWAPTDEGGERALGYYKSMNGAKVNRDNTVVLYGEYNEYCTYQHQLSGTLPPLEILVD